MRDQQQQQLREQLGLRVQNPRDLIRILNISQPTLSRLIQSMSDEIVVMGKGRSTCYGLPRTQTKSSSNLPIYQIDPRGEIDNWGELTLLQSGQYWLEQNNCGGELHNHIPWQLQDLLVRGYGGRFFAQSHHKELELPSRLSDWSDADKLFAIEHFGEQQSGNLLLGESSLARFQEQRQHPPQLLAIKDQARVYPQLAKKTITADYQAAQVGGEQPKFAVCLDERGTACHMLVKFSPAIDGAVARRYADLLVCEHLAMEAVRTAGLDAIRTRLIMVGRQAFLTIKRFDRRGEFGRLPTLSLKSVHSRMNHHCDRWINAANRLEQQQLFSPSEANRLRWLSMFSDFVGNTNQHFENINLIPRRHNSYILAPAYGIRPTLYEPIAGELPQRLFSPPAQSGPEIDSAREAAILFWKSAAIDERLSDSFRQTCYENCELLKLQTSRSQATP